MCQLAVYIYEYIDLLTLQIFFMKNANEKHWNSIYLPLFVHYVKQMKELVNFHTLELPNVYKGCMNRMF